MQYPETSDSSDVPVSRPGYVTRDESSQIGLPAVFDRGPGFESLTEAAAHGAAMGRPFLEVLNSAAGTTLRPISVLVSWHQANDRAAVSVQFDDQDDVDSLADFYGLSSVDDGGPTLYSRRGVAEIVDLHDDVVEVFELQVFSGRRRGDQ